MNLCFRACLLCFFGVLPFAGRAQFLYWDFYDVVTDAQWGGGYADMAVDGGGASHIVYWDHHQDRLMYLHEGTGGWTREYVDMAHPNGYRAAIALDGSGGIHVAYLENVNGIAQVRYAQRAPGGGWTVEQIPGDNLRGWGPYGPSGSITVTERIQHSVDVLITEGGEPVVVFFDGWMAPGAFPACSASSDYGFKLHQAFRTGLGSWGVRSFGDVPDVRRSCGPNANAFPMPKGDRYGEYCNLVQRADSSLQVFGLSRFNNRVMYFQTAGAGLDTTWAYGDVDSLMRSHAWGAWTDRWFTFEGIGVHVDDIDAVHLSYTGSMFYGENFCCGDSMNKFFYARMTEDTLVYHEFAQGDVRNHTDITVVGQDTVLIAYANLGNGQFELMESHDRGLTWAMDTIVAGVGIGRSPMSVVGDSIVVLLYEAYSEKLMLGRRALTGGEWRIEVIHAGEQHGVSLDGAVLAFAGDTIAYTAFNDSYQGSLHFASATTASGWNFGVTNLTGAGGGVEAVSLGVSSGGQPVVVYGGTGSPAGSGTGSEPKDLRMAVLNGGTWSYSVIDSNAHVKFTDVQVSALDTVHVVYYNDALNCLQYAKRHLGGNAWVHEAVDCATQPVGQYPSLQLDAQGLPHVAYHDALRRSLKYATVNAQSRAWEIDSVNGGSPSSIGKYCALRLDAAGNPKIAYLDEQATTVLLSERNAAGLWAHAVVDSAPISGIGRPTDMEIDAHGKVWIAYNHYSNFDKVKLMHRDSTWQEVGVSVAGQLANSFVLRILGGDLHIIGKKNAPQNHGVAMLRAPNGVHVWMDAAQRPLRDVVRAGVYPNPVGDRAVFWVEAETACVLGVRVYDLYGREVGVVAERRKFGAGRTELDWETGGTMPAGVYIYVVEGDGGTVGGKVVVK